MAYFSPKQDGFERAMKVAAELCCAALFVTFSIAFFGTRDGLIGFAIIEACLLAIDWFTPDEDAAGSVIR